MFAQQTTWAYDEDKHNQRKGDSCAQLGHLVADNTINDAEQQAAYHGARQTGESPNTAAVNAFSTTSPIMLGSK